MAQRVRQLAGAENGFSFIELLVVILIVGILAAIVIPSFLSQTNKAYNASAKELARTAQTTADSLATDDGGAYGNVTPSLLASNETTIVTSSTSTTNNAWVYSASGNADSFVVTAEAYNTAELFSIVDNRGTVSRVCGKAGAWTPPVVNAPPNGVGVATFTHSSDTSGGCVNGTW